jgi:hypothetical protein
MWKKAKYRPAAPGDGFGGINLNDGQLEDQSLLLEEARKYARRHEKADATHSHPIGSDNYQTNRALIYVVEAARSLCAAEDDLALKLLRMAIKDIKQNSTRKVDVNALLSDTLE